MATDLTPKAKCNGVIIDQVSKEHDTDHPKKIQFSCSYNKTNYNIEITEPILENISDSHYIGLDIFRKTTIQADAEVKTSDYMELFNLIDQLVMLFDGQFMPLKKIAFSGNDQKALNEAAKFYLEKRVSMYKSADFMRSSAIKLGDFYSLVNDTVMSRWLELRDNLDIIHAAMLYNMAETGLTVDWKCANMIETFEPLAELVGVYNNFFPALKAEDRNTTLKMCLDAVISWFGTDIFHKEYATNKEQLLKIFVWSRNRFMHIKRNQSKDRYLSAKESVVFAVKLSCLYRRILLDLLGIDYALYKDEMREIIEKWNNHQNILSRFIASLKT